MERFPKPIVVVSKCLGFDNCRYNGQIIQDHFVDQLRPHVEFQPVCPEVKIGLGVPRDPIRIVEHMDKKILYQPVTGKDVTGAMDTFVNNFLDSIGEVDGFILKNRSPSCGPADVKVYNSLKKDAGVVRGRGYFGGEVIKRYSDKSIEDEGRLKSFTIREHFLTKLFALARFRLIKMQLSMRTLVEFHTIHKYLLMAYNQTQLKQLGKIVANHEKKDISEVLCLYETHFSQALAKIPRYKSIINVLLHAFGGISKNLKPEERRFFLNKIEEYRDERIPLSVLIHLLEAWAIGQDNKYLLSQIFIKPYPRELVEIIDSGKGRNQ